MFQLRSFLQVAEQGSMTRAAETLYLTQPAVTQHIRALERELGTLLFDRTGRGVRLTEAGLALREYAGRSTATLDECRQVISDLKSGSGGRLVLGAGVTISIFDLPDWLSVFQKAHPGVDVVVRTGRSREVEAFVLGREVDLGLVTSLTGKPSLTVAGLYEEDFILVAPVDHALAGRAIKLEELTDVPLILFPPGSSFRERLDAVLAGAGLSARVKMETDSVEAIKSFVAAGLGVSFLPSSAVEEEIRSEALAGVLVPDLPTLKRTVSVIHRTDRYLSVAAREFLGMLSQRYASSRVGISSGCSRKTPPQPSPEEGGSV